MKKKNYIFQRLFIAVAAIFWLRLGFSYQYTQSYKVLITVPGSTKEYYAGDVTRLNS